MRKYSYTYKGVFAHILKLGRLGGLGNYRRKPSIKEDLIERKTDKDSRNVAVEVCGRHLKLPQCDSAEEIHNVVVKV